MFSGITSAAQTLYECILKDMTYKCIKQLK
jgi:hypothetical protein